MEILNFHSNSDRTINIHLKESITHYIMESYNYIINTTLINIDSYSDDSSVAPEPAVIHGVDFYVPLLSPTSIMNLVTDSTLKLTEAIAAGNLTDMEVYQLQETDSLFYVHRSNLRINNVRFVRDTASDYSKSSNLIRAIYLQDKNITIMNTNIAITGNILYTNDPLSLHVENVYIDNYATMGGFIMNIDCNYPEAILTGLITLKNVTAEYSQERMANNINGFLLHTGPENVHIEDSHINLWGSLSFHEAPIEKQMLSSCNPDDSVVQSVEISNNYFTLSENPYENYFSTIFYIFKTDTIRQIMIVSDNNTYQNISNNLYALNMAYVTINTELQISNNVYLNVSGLQEALYSEMASKVIIQNEVSQETSHFGSSLYSIKNIDNLTLSNITIDNVSEDGNNDNHYIDVHANDNATVNIDTLIVMNTDIGLQRLIYTIGVIHTFSMSNSLFYNITIGESNYLLSKGEFHHVQISNLTFTNITSESSEDTDMYMIMIENINLDQATQASTITDINVVSSNIGLFLMKSVTGSASQAMLNISNISYMDSTFNSHTSLFDFTDMDSQQNLTVTIDNLSLSNLNFTQKGKLFNFRHQLLNQIIIQNSNINNIDSGHISVGSSDNYNNDNKSKVKLVNVTFDSISAKHGSIIKMMQNGQLEIEDCVFSNSYSYEKGAVMFSDENEVSVNIKNSTFTNNTAINGAIFYISNTASVIIEDSEFINNFAITSGVVEASEDGRYELHN